MNIGSYNFWNKTSLNLFIGWFILLILIGGYFWITAMLLTAGYLSEIVYVFLRRKQDPLYSTEICMDRKGAFLYRKHLDYIGLIVTPFFIYWILNQY